MGKFERERGSSSSRGRDSDRPRSRDRVDRGDSGGFGRRDSGSFGGDREPRRFGGADHSRGREEGRGFGRRDPAKSGLMKFPATCDKCGEACELPFKPTNSKPVYCSDCFREKEGGSDGRGSSGGSSRELEQINQKLDKIMKVLKID